MNTPQKISLNEWREIMEVPLVKEVWKITVDESAQQLASIVYGVKFTFMGAYPGYQGDLYILHADNLGEPPITLIRKDGALQPAYIPVTNHSLV
jgi:hypothetical protein